MDFSSFQQPDSILRPAPFWSINDRLTPQETARQMADMRSVGLSGGFFHSRAGLVTDYLSDDWFAAMDAALAVAKETDGYLWLYDEDRWPSGNCGGLVAGMKDEFRAAVLVAEIVPAGEAIPDEPETAVLAVYQVTFAEAADGLIGSKGGGFGARASTLNATAIAQLPVTDASTKGDRLVLRRRYAPKIGWWGGESYANLLDPEVTQEFIRRTHDVYAKHYQQEFGKRIPGIFTDEPNISSAPNGIAWYAGLPTLYAEWTGRDFWADLPYLFFNGPESRSIRLLIQRTIARQFCEGYTRPLYQWCEAHGLKHTGHMLVEDSIRGQISTTYGGVMAHYRYEQMPGIDHLCRQTDDMLLTTRQVNSAARQLGRPHVLNEIFGVSRHTNTFEDFRWLGDYSLVNGANFLCPHLTLYSAKGRRKRDYPPNWNYQQTYWHELMPLTTYFGRLGYALTSGEPQCDVLLLHPIESMTAERRFGVKIGGAVRGEDWGAVDYEDRTFRRVLDAILTAGIECDLGDEVYLSEMAAVEGDRLRVGQMRYHVVVVPPARTWRAETLALLQQFAAAGGQLIFLGETPSEVDCTPTDAWSSLVARAMVVPSSTAQVQAAIAKVTTPGFTLRGPDGRPAARTYLQHRKDGDQQTFFFVNNDRERAQQYTFVLDAPDAHTSLAIWDAVTGERCAAATTRVGEALHYHFTLPPCGSVLLVAGPGAADGLAPATKLPDLAGGTVQPLPHTWQFSRSEPNVLVIDRLDVSLDNGQTWWGEDMEFRQRRKLAEHFRTREALDWQPWVSIRKHLFDDRTGDVVLRYRFQSAVAHPKSYVVIEDLTKGAVSVNGHPIDHTGAGWHWDHDFGKVEITDLVQAGENVIDFRVRYNFMTEVEAAYVVGDFGVRLCSPSAGEIIPEATTLRDGSWLEQGYPFYSGAMTYRTTFVPQEGRAFLHLNNASGILYRVRVNGNEVGMLLWRPHLLELTNSLQPGENVLEIDVISSRQNTLGPLHEKDGDDNRWVGPPAFEAENNVREALSLFDYGLLDGAEIVYVK